jgi:hypothetical protein
VRRKRRRLDEAMVVRQKARAELLGQHDIERVRGREIVPVAQAAWTSDATDA